MSLRSPTVHRSPIRRVIHNVVIPKSPLRSVLFSAGRRASPAHLAYLGKVLSYLEAGQWLTSEHASPEIVRDDLAVFEVARHRIVGQSPLYLEFGVGGGRSMRWWSCNLSHPDAKMVGFDSFQGLPEDWSPWYRAGAFGQGGPPQIDDSRVSFQTGWFEETLPCFTVPDHDQMILNVDSDLYSSASTVLRWAEPYLRPGTLIYFDEFPDRDHERKAFTELCERSSFEFKPVAVARNGTNWLFETLEGASNTMTSNGRTRVAN
jgi:Macrocin-O-methyltransferase (TylF)